MREVFLEQGSDEWLNWRAGKRVFDLQGNTFEAVTGGPRITATAASVIAGSNPFQKPHELWLEMLGMRKRQEATFAMQRGNAMEPKARAAFMKIIGEEYEPVCIQSSTDAWIAASLDGVDLLRTQGVEIKCPISQNTHDFALRGEVPPYYYDQIQWQFMASDNTLSRIFYYSWAPKMGEAPPIEVLPNLARQSELLRQAEIFRRHIDTKVPLSGTEFEAAAKNFLIFNRRAKEIKEQMDKVKEQLKELSGGKPTQGGGVMVTISNSQGSLNWQSIAKALAAQQGLSDQELAQLCEQHRGLPSVVFSVKESVEADAIYEQLMNEQASIGNVSTPDIVSNDESEVNISPNW